MPGALQALPELAPALGNLWSGGKRRQGVGIDRDRVGAYPDGSAAPADVAAVGVDAGVAHEGVH